MHHTVKVENAVKSFNDGFTTSKADDAANGSLYAQRWMDANKIGYTDHKVTDQVKSYNDGFTTSKMDDAANGSQFASQWLDHHISPDE